MARPQTGLRPGAARPASRALAVAVALGGLVPCVAAAGGLTPGGRSETEATCARDVLVAGSMQRQATEQLEAGGEDDASRCRVWRRHVDTMRRLAGVYGRCLSGPERKQRLAEVQGSETEFGGLIRSRCKGL